MHLHFRNNAVQMHAFSAFYKIMHFKHNVKSCVFSILQNHAFSAQCKIMRFSILQNHAVLEQWPENHAIFRAVQNHAFSAKYKIVFPELGKIMHFRKVQNYVFSVMYKIMHFQTG